MSRGGWIWGRRPVLEALRARSVRRVLVSQTVEDQFRRELSHAASEAGVPLEVVDRTRIDGVVASGKAQGVVAAVEHLGTAAAEDIIRRAVNATRPALLLVVEEVQDPRNLGALIRSADAAGCQGALVTGRRSAPLTGTVVKASGGAVHHIPIGSVGNMSQLLVTLMSAGIWTVGLTVGAAATLYELDLTAPTAIIVGNEEEGLKRLTRERVDVLAAIPLEGHVESLNVSVAGAVALFEAVRQRTRLCPLGGPGAGERGRS